MDDLHGKVALVTGGGSGIGLAIARALAAQGVRLHLLGINLSSLETAAAELPSELIEGIHIADVADRHALYAIAEALRSRGATLDILVNNAGIAFHAAPLHETPDEVLERLFQVNAFGMFYGIKAFLPLITGHGRGGHILNVGSIGGFQIFPERSLNAGAYAATKFAVTAMSEALRIQLAPLHIGVTLLAPGPVRTALARSSHTSAVANREGRNEAFAKLLAQGVGPEEVAACAVRAIRANTLYAFTHTDTAQLIEQRHQRIRAAFADIRPAGDVRPSD